MSRHPVANQSAQSSPGVVRRKRPPETQSPFEGHDSSKGQIDSGFGETLSAPTAGIPSVGMTPPTPGKVPFPGKESTRPTCPCQGSGREARAYLTSPQCLTSCSALCRLPFLAVHRRAAGDGRANNNQAYTSCHIPMPMFHTPIMPMSSCSRMWQWNIAMPSKSFTGTSMVTLPPIGTSTVSFNAGMRA